MDGVDFRQYNHLIIEGVHHNREQLINEIVPSLINSDEEWKPDIGRFISVWLNDSETVTVNTSGSTGTPKAIEIKKSAMVLSAQKTIRFFDVKPNSKALLALPARYIAGRMMIVRAFVGKWDISFKNPSSLEISDNEHYNFTALVPLQAEKLLNSNFNFNNSGTLILGGATTPPALAQQLSTYNVWETYGMTETVSHIALRKCGDTYFTPLDGVFLSTDNRGCLVIGAPGISDKTLITNDIVELSNDGRFTFCGRADNVINSGGIKLFPEQIEKKLQPIINSPFVIIGLPHLVLGEQVVLIIQADMGISNLGKIIATHLSKYEIPKKIFFIPQLFYTNNGKLDRLRIKRYITDLQQINNR